MYKYRTEFNADRRIDLVKEKISWTGRSEGVYCSSEALYDLCTSRLKMNLMRLTSCLVERKIRLYLQL